MGDEGDLVAPRLARGCRCFVVSVDGAIAGYGWLSTGPEWIGELQLEIRPQPGEGYIWNCVTLAEHRRKGVFASLLVGICEVARGEGLKRLWIGSVAIPAERAVAPSGFRPVLRFTSYRAVRVYAVRVHAIEPRLADEARSRLNIRSPFRLAPIRPRVH